MGRGLRLISAMLLVAMSGSMTGCKYEQLRADRDDLWSQNQELQGELTQTRLALEAAQSDRDRLLAQRDQFAEQGKHRHRRPRGEYGLWKYPGR